MSKATPRQERSLAGRAAHGHSRLAALLLFAAVAAGCSDWTESAKVLPDAPFLALEERWRLDGNTQLLGPVGWVVVGPGDGVFIGHPLDRRIAAFDSLGVRREVFGGAGRDPGQFQNLMRAGTVGDTLWVYDGVLRRVTMFGPGLDLARTFVWPPPRDAEAMAATRDATVPYLLGITPGGSIVASVYRERSGEQLNDPVATSMPGEIAIAIPDRTLLAAHPVPPDVVYGDGFRLENTRLFPIDPVFAAASNGAAFVYVETHVDGPLAGTFRVTRLDAAGDTIFVRDHPFYPVEIPGEVADEAIDRAVRRLRARGQGTPAAIEAFRASVQIPPVYPPVLGAVVGRDGSTWLRMRPLVEGQSEYYVLDGTGSFVGQLSVPGRLDIVEAESTRLWSIATSSIGVESLVVYSVDGYAEKAPDL